MRFTEHKVSSNVNDKMFSDFIKNEKTLFLGSSVFGRLRKYISTLTFNPNLGEGEGGFIPLVSLFGNFVFMLFTSSKRLKTF